MRGAILCAAAVVAWAVACSGNDRPACVRLTCADLGASCGALPDGCGGSLACGTCAGSDLCGGGGVAGVCAAATCTMAHWCWLNPLPQGNPLFAVNGVAPDDAWAVGPAGTLLHFDGSRWIPVDPGGDLLLEDVWAVSADDVWAVGALGVTIHLSGGVWSPVPSGVTVSLDGVWAS